ncbi:MAG: MBL fold metallo-hydrolase [Coriobacteriia bacterium]|nr:MBL fold metallo-hydrolase [Coriobacteriia bacterium]
MPNVPDTATRLTGDTYVVSGLTNAGLIAGLGIDTSENEAAYTDVPLELLAITHGHADHFSIAHLLRAAGVRVIAPRDDAAMVENPDINIRGMFSWAKPSDKMTTKLFRGVGCAVDGLVEDFNDPRATAIPLPGHTLGHHGFLTADGVLFTGDSLYLRELWKQHPLPYAIDPGMVVASLELIRTIDCDWIVPSHGRPVPRDEAIEHIDFHIMQVHRTAELLLEGLHDGLTTEDAVAFISRELGLAESPAVYWLAVTDVKGYLGELLDRGLIEFSVRDHAGWWQTVARPTHSSHA